MSLTKQVELEPNEKICEIYVGVHNFINNSSNMEINEIVNNLQSGLAKHSEPSLCKLITRDLVVNVVATIVAKGQHNLTILQSVASTLSLETELDTRMASLEIVTGVCAAASYLRNVYFEGDEGDWWVVSDYPRIEIDMAVFTANNPMLQSSTNFRHLIDIDSNMYYSDVGYKVMLGSKFNRHEDPLPLWELNYLSSIPFALEDCTHQDRPPRKSKKSQPCKKELDMLADQSAIHTKATRESAIELYNNGNRFFFAHSFDKRLRVYSKGYQVNLQGTEYDKSILEFSDKQFISASGLRWLYIATANVFGSDKETFDVRIKWVTDNLANLEEFTSKAEEPLLFAKHVRAIRNVESGLRIGIPIHMDATNSGAQLIGSLLAEADTLRDTNVIHNEDRQRMDFYSKVYEAFPDLGLSRKEIKSAVMPALFGSEAEPKKIFGEYVEHFWKMLELNYPAVHWYIKMLPQLWRDDITEYKFTLPDGYKVYIPVTGFVYEQVTVEVLDGAINLGKEVIGCKSHSKCFLANIIHSIDAYVLRNIVKKCEVYGIAITVIHDSFGTHPNDMENVAQWYREELSKIIEANLLPKLLEEIFGVLVALPMYGDRDKLASLALQSEYALS